MTTPVDLIVIACEGRANLLAETLQSFLAHNAPPFARRILALDGEDAEALAVSKLWDLRVVGGNGPRRGLFQNMKAAYALAQAPLVFHLEEDWRLIGTVPLDIMAAGLQHSPYYGQVRLSNHTAIIPREDGLFDEEGSSDGRGMTRDACGLYAGSASCAFGPHLARRLDFLEFVRRAESGKVDASLNVEWVHRRWHLAHGRISAVVDPAIGRVEHIGGGDPTDKGWHQISPTASGRVAA